MSRHVLSCLYTHFISNPNYVGLLIASNELPFIRFLFFIFYLLCLCSFWSRIHQKYEYKLNHDNCYQTILIKYFFSYFRTARRTLNQTQTRVVIYLPAGTEFSPRVVRARGGGGAAYTDIFERINQPANTYRPWPIGQENTPRKIRLLTEVF